MKLALATYNLTKDWDLDRIIQMCAPDGFEGVEPDNMHAHGVEVDLHEERRREGW